MRGGSVQERRIPPEDPTNCAADGVRTVFEDGAVIRVQFGKENANWIAGVSPGVANALHLEGRSGFAATEPPDPMHVGGALVSRHLSSGGRIP